MTGRVRRAAAFGAVGALSLVVPALLGVGANRVAALASGTGMSARVLATVLGTAPFVLVAGAGVTVVTGGPLFELFARPGDRRDEKLYGLAGFALAAAGLALLSLQFGLPAPAFAGAILALSIGNLGATAVETVRDDPVVRTAGFVGAGALAGAAAMGCSALLLEIALTGSYVAEIAFLATSAALLGALLRSVLFERDDPLVMISIAFLLWLLMDLPLAGASTTRIAVALGVTVVLGSASIAIETASLPGMLTGVLLGLLTIVLGGYGWFGILIAFFALGGLSTKFRYEEKAQRGIAQENEGARGSGNVLANSLVALVALLGAAASPSHTTVDPQFFFYAFAGSLAAAMSDTFSSEFGGLYDNPRLITTLERVEAGTDGGVTWQGELAGLAGAAIVAVIALLAFPRVGALGTAVVLGAGFLGMTVDSLLGATVEGRWLNNQGVNLAATAAAAVGAVVVVFAASLV